MVLFARSFPGRIMVNRCASFLGLAALTALPLASHALQTQVDFTRDVQPILQKHCYTCHSGEKVTAGGLRLDVRAAAMKGGDSGLAIVPGNSEHSLIIGRVRGLGGLE